MDPIDTEPIEWVLRTFQECRAASRKALDRLYTEHMPAPIAPELERKPFVAAVLTSQFLDLIRSSGASYEEANCALKAAHALLQCLPLPLSAPPDGGESAAEDCL